MQVLRPRRAFAALQRYRKREEVLGADVIIQRMGYIDTIKIPVFTSEVELHGAKKKSEIYEAK